MRDIQHGPNQALRDSAAGDEPQDIASYNCRSGYTRCLVTAVAAVAGGGVSVRVFLVVFASYTRAALSRLWQPLRRPARRRAAGRRHPGAPVATRRCAVVPAPFAH